MDTIQVGEVFTITNENNEEQEIEVLGTIMKNDTQYIAVSFVEDLQQNSNEDIDIFFLKADEEGYLSAIESDEEFEEVSEQFGEIMNGNN